MEKIYGITQRSNNREETYEYQIGSDGHIPVVLLALVAANRKSVVERYLSLYSYTQKAQELIKELYKANPNLAKEVEHIGQVFDERDDASQKRMLDEVKRNGGLKPFEGFTKSKLSIVEQLENYPRDAIMGFHMYTSYLASYMIMKTAEYDGGAEGVPQACSMSYIAFMGREEFKQAHSAINTAFTHLVDEIVRVMKLRNMPVNEESMTIELPSYKAISFTQQMYPGF